MPVGYKQEKLKVLASSVYQYVFPLNTDVTNKKNWKIINNGYYREYNVTTDSSYKQEKLKVVYAKLYPEYTIIYLKELQTRKTERWATSPGSIGLPHRKHLALLQTRKTERGTTQTSISGDT